MRDLRVCSFDRIVFESALVRMGCFRCRVGDPSFHDTGPSRNFCFVFPRTAVEIQHEHEAAFVANPNVITFYNQGQAYCRNPISTDGDRCDWFGVHTDVVRDVIAAFDPLSADANEMPFRFSRAPSNARIYLSQRRIFQRAISGNAGEPLIVEEYIISLLERVVRSAYRGRSHELRKVGSKQREVIRHTEHLLCNRLEERLTLPDIAGAVGMSPYHLCRMFHQVTRTTLHEYRQKLRLRWSLESVTESDRSLVDIALDSGFSSHSHFTSAFREEFAVTPSSIRAKV